MLATVSFGNYAWPFAQRVVHAGTRDGVFGERHHHVRCFFPAARTSATGAVKTPYVPKDVPHLRGLALFAKLPVILFSHLSLVETNSFLDVEPLPVKSKDKKPLVVFCHGLGGTRATYSAFCNELASVGYVS